MGRFLFVVPPLTGHINPTVSIAVELMRSGHEVAWAGHRDHVQQRLPAGSTLFDIESHVTSRILVDGLKKSQTVRGLASLKFLWEDFFIPLAKSMVAGVDAAVDAFRPDALVVDQQALAGSIVASRRDLPWATLATTSATLAQPFQLLPTVRDWVDHQLAELDAQFGIERRVNPDLSPDCVIVCSTREFVGNLAPSEARFVWVGPSVRARRDSTSFPMDFLLDPSGSPATAVLVSLGTLNASRGERFYNVVCNAVRDRAIRVVIAAPPELVPNAPDNVLVQPWVPQLELLPKMSAIVTHGGHNTVCEALLYGVPMVVAPIKDDQPVVAGLVVQAGVGERVHFGRVKVPTFSAALDRVLTESHYRENAAAIGDSFRRAGGAVAAAQHLISWLPA